MAFKASQFLFHGSGVPPASKCLSHQALQLNCFIQKVDSGLYSLLPLGQLVIDRINRLIEDEFSRIGALRISVPILGPKKLWDETERWDAMGKELFQLSDRGKNPFCLQPTAEEMVTSLVRNLPSLRVASLPLLLYQTTEKFRDERNPRFGLIRGRQFLMNDMYSFDVDVDSCQKTYSLVTSAYRRIFKDALQLEIRTVVSDPGVHGGAISHEYHLENNLEEDKISYCSRCEIGHKPGETDPQCSHSELQEMSSIEIAHTFQLGTRYAQAFKAFVPGTQRPLEMGCYGIGVSRLLPACVDALSIDVKAIRLPNKIVPFDAAIIMASKLSSDPTALSLCEELQSALQARNMTVLLHDMHKMSVGDRLYDLNRIGIPRIFVLANVTKRSFSTEIELSAVGRSGEVRLDMVTITSGTDRDHRNRDRSEKNGTIGSSNAERHKSNGLELRVLTLNMWCLSQPWPVGSKDRKHRLKRLAEALLIEEYDIVGLQEIWKEGDYLNLVDQLKDVYKFHHYFHSGWTGSGVCILSRHPIVSTLTHRYSLNGFAHHVHRGDWFGGKVVGMVELEIGDCRVNFYSTHLHAEYNRENDLYLPHRTAQAFELSQFVRHTAHGADAVIVVGDLNLEPVDLGYRIILAQAELLDAWRLSHEAEYSGADMDLARCRGVGRGGTSDRPDNSYSSILRQRTDESKRIDYILFKSGRMNMSLEECEITMNKIPGEEINYSDHVGVHARFLIDDTHRQVSQHAEPHRPLLIEAIGYVAGGQRRARTDRLLFFCSAAVLFSCVLVSVFFEPNNAILSMGLAITRFVLTVIAVFCIWYGLIGLTLELKSLKAAKQSMQQLLND